VTTTANKLMLWPAGALDLPQNHQPSLQLFSVPGLPAHAPTVLILPGGGYREVVPHESEPVARWLNEHGFHATILRYRVGAAGVHPAPMLDAQRAMRLIRCHAAEWGLGAGLVGVIGFSAGAHLGSMLANLYDRFGLPADDLAARYSSRPNAAALCYGLYDLVNHPSRSTREGKPLPVLGERAADPKLLHELSTVHHVYPAACPHFLWHTKEDEVVPVENSIALAEACKKAGVVCELHTPGSTPAKGRHGEAVFAKDWKRSPLDQPLVDFLTRHLDPRKIGL